MAPSPARPVIIDTDPGLDDAVAILLALASPEFEVLGLTTVAGNLGLDVTTRNALRLLHLGLRDDIPVIRGAAAPLSREGGAIPDVHGDDGLGGVALPDPPRGAAQREALGWLVDTLLRHPPGTVDLFALGPLTNLARLIEERPDAARRLRRVVAMGGAIHEPGNAGPRAEFNMAADPEAAAIVFESVLPVALVPLDMTRRVRASLPWTSALAGAGRPAARAAAALVEAYFTSTAATSAIRESRPLHDPCVMLYALAPELFAAERTGIQVEADGATVPREGAPLIDVVLSGDAEAALRLLAERLARL